MHLNLWITRACHLTIMVILEVSWEIQVALTTHTTHIMMGESITAVQANQVVLEEESWIPKEVLSSKVLQQEVLAVWVLLMEVLGKQSLRRLTARASHTQSTGRLTLISFLWSVAATVERTLTRAFNKVEPILIIIRIPDYYIKYVNTRNKTDRINYNNCLK